MQEWRKPDIISKVYFPSYVEYLMNHKFRKLFTVRYTTEHIYGTGHIILQNMT
jgi:hypothetical protein